MRKDRILNRMYLESSDEFSKMNSSHITENTSEKDEDVKHLMYLNNEAKIEVDHAQDVRAAQRMTIHTKKSSKIVHQAYQTRHPSSSDL